MKFPGIDSDRQKELLVGVGLGLSLLIIQLFSPISIIDLFVNLVYPTLPYAVSDRFILVVFVAAPIEEPLFRGLLPLFLVKIMPQFVADRVSNIIFSGFHYFVYGVGAAAAFIGAYAFGEIATFLKYKNNSLMPGIAFHSTVNAVIVGLKFLVVGA